MKIQAEVSLYPLRQNDLTKPIRQFVQVMENDKLKIKTGAMSSLIAGESQVVFEKLQKAFEKLAQRYEIVLTAKISNACPKVNQEK